MNESAATIPGSGERQSQSTWNPQQYDRFRDERSQPFWDLLDLVRPRPAMRVVDLGCGTGSLTAGLHRQLAARETLGLDSSQTMLARSAAHVVPGLRFQRGDIATFMPEEPFDLVFSNAALHWLPDHERLFASLTRTAVRPAGGQLAVQMPANFDHPSHVVANEVAREEPFRSVLGGYVREMPVLAPERYAALLERLGYTQQHVRLQVYVHHLASRDAVVEWVKGTLLTDFQKRLPADLFEKYLTRYRAALLPRLEDAMPYVYPFKRILLWGMR